MSEQFFKQKTTRTSFFPKGNVSLFELFSLQYVVRKKRVGLWFKKLERMSR